MREGTLERNSAQPIGVQLWEPSNRAVAAVPSPPSASSVALTQPTYPSPNIRRDKKPADLISSPLHRSMYACVCGPQREGAGAWKFPTGNQLTSSVMVLNLRHQITTWDSTPAVVPGAQGRTVHMESQSHVIQRRIPSAHPLEVPRNPKIRRRRARRRRRGTTKRPALWRPGRSLDTKCKSKTRIWSELHQITGLDPSSQTPMYVRTVRTACIYLYDYVCMMMLSCQSFPPQPSCSGHTQQCPQR
jgi:hypothetical protein